MRLVAALALTAILSCCTQQRQPGAVPRQHAYPRIQLYTPDYVTVTTPLGDIAVNSHAVVTADSIARGGARWLTWTYPRYEATVYVTVTPVTQATAAKVMENRLERISLNAYGTRPFVSYVGNDRFQGSIYLSPRGTATPVQFLSTDNETCIVSGAVCLDNAGAVSNSDSIAPVVDALATDITHLLENL